MSSNDDDGPGRREVAHRLFAAEFDDADFSYSESDEERAPNYVITPSGARVNRLFLVGVLTETEWVNDDMLRARIVDPTGAFVSYAGQYQPDALGFLERAEPPAFLAVTGKARTFEPEDGDRVFTSVRPESISEVDADTRDRWVVEAAKRTVDRVETMAAAMETDLAGDELVAALEADGVDSTLASGIALAVDHYGTTPAYLEALRELAEDALETVAGERDEVRPLDVAPDEGGGDASTLAGGSISSRPKTDDDDETVAAEPETGDESAPDTEPTDASADTTAGAESTGTDAAESTDEPAVEIDDSPTTAEQDTAADDSPDVTAATTQDAEVGGTDDELGDFEPDEALGDFDPEEDEALTEEERREVEAEFDTGFSTGNEVEAEPDLEPDTEPEAESDTDPEAEPDTEPEAESDESDEATEPDADGDGTETEPADEDKEPADDVPLDDAVMETMETLDDGDGTDRDELVATVTDRTGADADAVEDAIEDALMSGRCYEPEDGLLKPI